MKVTVLKSDAGFIANSTGKIQKHCEKYTFLSEAATFFNVPQMTDDPVVCIGWVLLLKQVFQRQLQGKMKVFSFW